MDAIVRDDLGGSFPEAIAGYDVVGADPVAAVFPFIMGGWRDEYDAGEQPVPGKGRCCLCIGEIRNSEEYGECDEVASDVSTSDSRRWLGVGYLVVINGFDVGGEGKHAVSSGDRDCCL